MKRHEAVLIALLGFLMVAAGLTWRFGFYGLVGPGVGLLAALAFVDMKGDD